MRVMDTKKPWASTTLWVNLLAILAAILLDRLGYIGHDEAIGIVFVALGNFGLRFKATKPVKL